MKELNRTDRLTIASILIALVFIIGFFTLKENKVPFELSPEEGLALMSSQDGLLPGPAALSGTNPAERSLLADLRSPSDFRQDHPGGSVNIPFQDLLLPDNLEKIRDWSEKGGIIMLSSNDQMQVNGAWAMLRQLGIDQVYIIPEERPMTKKSISDPPLGRLDEARHDFKSVAETFSGSGSTTPQNLNTPVAIPVIKREKKTKAEGGC
jgi:rhodanese-related sulfurtransferase